MKRTRGFTLIELLVVIAIIGLLASVVLASLESTRAKARDAKRISDLEQIRNALELYRADHGRYPGPETEPTTNVPWFGSEQVNSAARRNNWIYLKNELAPYIDLPSDPRPRNPTNLSTSIDRNAGYYTYEYRIYRQAFMGCDFRQSYFLVTRLESNKKFRLGPGIVRCDNGEIVHAHYTTPSSSGLYTTGMGK